jgi:hypothetical protein
LRKKTEKKETRNIKQTEKCTVRKNGKSRESERETKNERKKKGRDRIYL